jgi:hypothetical protein
MAYTFDFYDFQKTAELLFILNSDVVDRHGDPYHFVEWMKSQTIVEMKGPGYWGTMGFRVSVCQKAGGGPKDLYATASLTPFIVGSHFEKLRRLLS